MTAKNSDDLHSRHSFERPDILENLMTLVSELVISRNQLVEIARLHQDEALAMPLQRLSQVTSELQSDVLSLKRAPVASVIGDLDEMVRTACSADREVTLTHEGFELEIDRGILPFLAEVVHVCVSNSVLHGIEERTARRLVGKSETGRVHVAVRREDTVVVVEVDDDGRGLGERVVQGSRASATRAFLEEVRTGGGALAQIVRRLENGGGSIDIETRPGSGLTIRARIPLPLAIVSALLVRIADQVYALPQNGLVELVATSGEDATRIDRIDDRCVLRLREHLVPVLEGERLFGEPSGNVGGYVAVLRAGDLTFGLRVDDVLQTEEIVVKPLARALSRIGAFCGASIRGDGSVALVFDTASLAARLAPELGAREGDGRRTGSYARGDVQTTESDDDRLELLVFRSRDGTHKAVPLSIVSRIETVRSHTIESVDGRRVLQYRDRLMPILSPWGSDTTSGDCVTLLVFSDGERLVALEIEEILDIVETRGIELVTSAQGILGTAVVAGKATEIVDVGHHIASIHPDWERSRDTVSRPGGTLLLVEDSAFFRNMLTPLVRAAGYRVLQATCARDALAIAAAEPDIACIVTDVEPPGAAGLTLLEGLREHGADVPVIGIASGLPRDDLDRATRLGLTGVVSKFDRSTLITAIENVARKTRNSA